MGFVRTRRAVAAEAISNCRPDSIDLNQSYDFSILLYRWILSQTVSLCSQAIKRLESQIEQFPTRRVLEATTKALGG
jgi:hypothetical protein